MNFRYRMWKQNQSDPHLAKKKQCQRNKMLYARTPLPSRAVRAIYGSENQPLIFQRRQLRPRFTTLLSVAATLVLLWWYTKKSSPSNKNGDWPNCNCPKNYKPVCSKTGVTYANECVLECAKENLAYQGECQRASPSGS